MSRKIYISHRHDEKEIADVVNTHLQLWGIPDRDIFQSSKAKHGPRIGGNLEKQLKKALSEAKLLIFIYTHAMYDWSYCTWECGVSMDPETEDTNIVIFECAGKSPSMFQPYVRVRVERDDYEEIKDFTFQFHKKNGFFPNQPPFHEGYSDQVLIQKAKQFHDDLINVIPEGAYTQTPLLHRITLALKNQDFEEIKKLKTPEAANNYIYRKLRIQEASPNCPKHFGFVNFQKRMKWSVVVKRWREKMGQTDAQDLWVQDTHSEIWRAIHNEPAKPSGAVITSVEETDRRYIPLVCLMREYPDGKRDFNVYLYRMA